MHLRNRTICLTLVALASAALAGVGEDLAKLTGQHTRVVWVQDRSKASGDTFAGGKHLVLMGLDSKDGKGARAILPGTRSAAKPLLTPDGQRVVYTDRHASQVRVVNFDGRNDRKVTDGQLADVWADPKTSKVWVIYQDARKGRVDKKFPIRRCLLDDPSADDLLWDRTAVSIDNFQLSADGTRAAGLFPWSAGGVAELPNKRWNKLASGCWTSLAPDNSYLFWIFDGPHRNVYMHSQAGDRWKVDIHRADGIRGFEVYHPRWSNHVRILTMTGPYLGAGGRPGGNRIRAGGKAVEIYVGRFAPDFRAVEKWVQVTDNQHGDFYPDVWVAGGEKTTVAATLKSAQPEVDAPSKKELATWDAWPGSTEDLVYVWDTINETNDIRDAKGRTVRTCRVVARGRAHFGRFGQMRLAGGAMLAPDAAKPLLAGIPKADQLTIEALITPAHLKQDGPARIVSFSSDASHRNFTLGQSGDTLVLRLRTPQTGVNGTEPQVTLAKLVAGKPQHVIVSYLPGRTSCYVDGKLVSTTGAIQGRLDNWTGQTLLFGDELNDSRDWAGELEAVALYSRFVTPAEAKRKYELVAKRLTDREKVPQITIEAELTATTAIPDPEGLVKENYRRALVVHEWKVRKVLAGKLDARQIAVAHWAVMDAKRLPEAAKLAKGTVRTLTVEPLDAHPELDSERQMNDLENFDLETYYQPLP